MLASLSIIRLHLGYLIGTVQVYAEFLVNVCLCSRVNVDSILSIISQILIKYLYCNQFGLFLIICVQINSGTDTDGSEITGVVRRNAIDLFLGEAVSVA